MPIPIPNLGDVLLGVNGAARAALSGVGSPDREGEDPSIESIIQEVERGLPNEYEPRINDAIKNQEFYDGEMEKHLKYREAETPWDHDLRRKRTRLLTRRIVDVLCEHLYNPGPQRRLESSAIADAWLAEQYAANHVDAVMQEADRLSTLNDVAALKVVATGNESAGPGPDSGIAAPIRIQVYGSEEFAVWCHPDDPTTPWVVATIDRVNEQRRVEVWTALHYWRFHSIPLGRAQTSGGRVMRFVPEESGANPYGTLPFAFVHYGLPVRRFWTEGPGTAIRKANERVNQELTDLSTAIQYHGSPQGYAYNVDPAWRPVNRPSGLTVVPPNKATIANGGAPPKIEFLQPTLNIKEISDDIADCVNGALEDHGVPRSAVRLEQSSASSGIAIIAEQLPLLTRAHRRQRAFGRYECKLAEVCLAVAGRYYGVDALVVASLSPQLQLTWPTIEIPVPGPDRDNTDLFEVDEGIASKLDLVMKRRGLTRIQAEAYLEQVLKDELWLKTMRSRFGLDQGAAAGEASGGPAPQDVQSAGEAEGEGDDGGGTGDGAASEADAGTNVAGTNPEEE